jgi:hypothetical protein
MHKYVFFLNYLKGEEFLGSVVSSLIHDLTEPGTVQLCRAHYLMMMEQKIHAAFNLVLTAHTEFQLNAIPFFFFFVIFVFV